MCMSLSCTLVYQLQAQPDRAGSRVGLATGRLQAAAERLAWPPALPASDAGPARCATWPAVQSAWAASLSTLHTACELLAARRNLRHVQASTWTQPRWQSWRASRRRCCCSWCWAQLQSDFGKRKWRVVVRCHLILGCCAPVTDAAEPCLPVLCVASDRPASMLGPPPPKLCCKVSCTRSPLRHAH